MIRNFYEYLWLQVEAPSMKFQQLDNVSQNKNVYRSVLEKQKYEAYGLWNSYYMKLQIIQQVNHDQQNCH